MAQDIVPVELGLTEGDLITLWAPRWREDGEEWEAFLGHGEHIYCFDDVAELAAFIRTVDTHDLTDHPAWDTVTGLAAAELEPEETHCFDIVGVPELAAGDPDAWTLSELDETVEMVRTLAEVCELDTVTEILDGAPTLALLSAGPTAFAGKDGAKRWREVGSLLAERWDEVVDALDGVAFLPEVDTAALATAQAELQAAREAAADDDTDAATNADDLDTDDSTDDDGETADGGFWGEVGIDPVRIVTSVDELWTLRCYLDDTPVFLGSAGRIEVFGSARALAKHLADGAENDLTAVVTWEQVHRAAVDGTLEVEATEDNTYVLPGLADDIAEGPTTVDPVQLELAVELFSDAGEFAGDESVAAELAGSSPLGWFVSCVLRPDPNRLAPTAPFDAEATAWRGLEDDFEARLNRH